MKLLIRNIKKFTPFKYVDFAYEHFHVPCSEIFINSNKLNGKVITEFVKVWIRTAEQFINNKPADLFFCKVVALINETYLWDSQILIFYDEKYYNSFWRRNNKSQIWTEVEQQYSIIGKRNISTFLSEVCYSEIINDDEDIISDYLWFYIEK